MPAARLTPLRPPQRVTVGPFEIEFIRVTHSVPDCVALAIHTPEGVVVHTGDFKIDQTPLDGEHFDIPRFAQLGSAGVLALFADSTNIDRRGFTGSEIEVVDAFEEIFTAAHGRLVVAAFSSSIYRMQLLVDLAAQFDRKVAFVGRGMDRNSRDRAAARLPAHSGGRADSRLGRRQLPRPGRAVPVHRVAGRADVRALPDCHRRSPTREARAPGHGGAVGALDSRQREGDRPRDQPHRPPRRGGDSRRHQARPRLRPRERRRAQADALARPAALFRAGPRGIPAARAACARRPTGVRGTRATARDPAGGKRRRAALRSRQRRGSPAKRRSAAS